MISSHQVFRLGPPNQSLEFEVNWNNNEDVRDCKKIRVILPKAKQGETILLRRDELNAMLFIMGKPDEQRKMIPHTERRSRWYETVVSVTATKDVKKGEKLTFPLKLTLPTFEQEVIAEAKKDMIKSNYTLIGN